MSQFMEVMMGQQSLLMTLANVVPRAPELPTGPVAGQPVVPPPVPHGQPQEVWDVDAVSRDASDAEPLFEEGTEPEVTSQHSEQDDPEVLDTNDPMWSVVERAARHLGVDWPASEPTRRSLFELPSAHTLQSRILPAFPDFIKEVQSTWGAPASTPATSRKAAAFNMHGASEAGLASFPPVGAAFAALVKAPTLSGLAKDPSCPNRQCRITEAHLKKGYAAATEAVRLSNVASLLTVYQAALLRDLPECPSAALRTELGTVAQLLVKLAQLNARAQGRSIASLVVARRQLWLSQARVQEPDKVPLLDAPISPGHTFGPAVEEMLQRSVKAREASQQLAKMWPSKPFQPRRPQERQWRRAPPQQQAQSRGSMTAPSGVSARGQPAFVRPQRGGWRPRGGGKPRPRGSGQAPQILCQREAPAEEELSEGHIPEQFAGLLHGSSPACDSPENPYQLYSKVRKYSAPEPRSSQNTNLQQTAEYNAHFLRTSSDASALKSTKECKPQVVYRTIFHTKVNQTDCGTFVTTRNVRNGDQWVSNASGGFEDRACTLGRMRSVPKNILDLQLTRNISKSDSNLTSCSPIEEETRNSRCDSATNKPNPGKLLERTPSFTAEWEEVSVLKIAESTIDKIMSSIGAGINTGLEEINEGVLGPRCPAQSVGQWLDNIGLVQYENHLLANGFDNVQFMGSNVVEDQDLLEIGILNSAHRQRFLQAIRLLPRVRPIGYDGNNPTSVAEWLESIDLGDYTKSFLINGYTSMDLVKKIWEIELINVLKISLLGHRKRVLASLGDRLHEEPPQKPPRSITLREPSGNHTPPQLSPSVSQSTYTTGGSLDIPQIIMQADARRRRNENYFEDVPRSKLERQMAQVSMAGEWCEPIMLRPPNEATSSTPVQYWQHHPEKLIFQSCDYEAYYLGSMLVKELRGTESTQDACAKMRNIIAEHEIRNISCAAQDPDDLSTFAYITKDLKSSHHYCHVFTAFDVNLAYEIILTLGQAFEVAYQLALQARKSGHGSSTLPESFENKPAKPIPKPRIGIRKSVWCSSDTDT
ncbi:UNVERIFIED_CONTAM: hypothetical protein FKN15_016139 [Acipenser sinensis]